jgi:hypothetical protein
LPDPETWLGKHPAWTSSWRSDRGLASPLLDLLAHQRYLSAKVAMLGQLDVIPWSC